MSPDLVVVGNLLVDDVVLPDGTTRMGQPGGAVLYVALGAALWGVRVGVCAVRGEDYPPTSLDALAERGVELGGVRELGRPGLRTWLLYEGRRRRVVHRLEGPSHAEVSPGPEHLPAGWLASRAVHLAPMPLEVQAAHAARRDVADGLTSLDPYVPVSEASLAELAPILAGIDAFFLSEDEVEVPDAESDPRLLPAPGRRPRLLVLKRGVAGGVVVDGASGERSPWAAWPTRVTDPTGAGDAFAAGFLAGWLRGDGTSAAARRGAVTASFAIEGWGADGLLAARPEAARDRLRAWPA